MTRSRVLVLGHRGMLGTAVCRRLTELGDDVITADARVAEDDVAGFAKSVTALGPDAIINCIAAIPSRAQMNGHSAFAINARLPLELALACDRAGIRLLQPSTDGVFRGDRGAYLVSDPPDATDDYGAAKAIAELARAVCVVTVIRCSIVSPKGGLLQWLLTSRGPVDGYTDHRWNGITVLEWAGLAHELLSSPSSHCGEILQPACEPSVSKFELLTLAARLFGHDVEIRPVESGHVCDRTLVPTIEMPPIRTQLARLREWVSA